MVVVVVVVVVVAVVAVVFAFSLSSRRHRQGFFRAEPLGQLAQSNLRRASLHDWGLCRNLLKTKHSSNLCKDVCHIL